MTWILGHALAASVFRKNNSLLKPKRNVVDTADTCGRGFRLKSAMNDGPLNLYMLISVLGAMR